MSALDNNVLVLNKIWIPINIINVVDAFIKLMNKKAKWLDRDYKVYEFENLIRNWEDINYLTEEESKRLIRTPNGYLLAPEIIIMNKYDKLYSKKIKCTRRNIFQRDNYTCQYCGNKFKKEDLTWDHVIPRSKGGTDRWTNLVTSCGPCNAFKANKDPKHFKLIRQPVKPRFIDIDVKRAPQSWENFISDLYWDVTLEE